MVIKDFIKNIQISKKLIKLIKKLPSKLVYKYVTKCANKYTLANAKMAYNF
jgi:hypothetical protein